MNESPNSPRRRPARSRDIPMRTKRLIIQEAGGVCPFCGERDADSFDFHHIHGKDGESPHDPDNLIYVCKNCHGKITAGAISESDVFLTKRILKFQGNPFLKKEAASNVLNFTGGVNAGTVANEYHYHNHGKSPKHPRPVPVSGFIGHDLLKRNYLLHLIKRYKEFAKAQKDREYKYYRIYTSIKQQFGVTRDMIPIELFDSACRYVQERIDATALGRNRKAHNQPNYSPFQEYCQKYIEKRK